MGIVSGFESQCRLYNLAIRKRGDKMVMIEVFVTGLLFVAVVLGWVFLRRHINWQEVMPLMAEVSRCIMDVEKTLKGSGRGAEKMLQACASAGTSLSAEDICVIQRSPFKTLKRFTQYVFSVMVEPTLVNHKEHEEHEDFTKKEKKLRSKDV